MNNLPLQDIIDKFENCFTHGELRKYIAQLLLDVRYANAYLSEAWEVVYPNPAERLYYMKMASESKPFIPFE